jgi:hypothetical protein
MYSSSIVISANIRIFSEPYNIKFFIYLANVRLWSPKIIFIIAV